MNTVYRESSIKSFINKYSKGYEITLEQLKSMNLPEETEVALFGRTSKEWEMAIMINQM